MYLFFCRSCSRFSTGLSCVGLYLSISFRRDGLFHLTSSMISVPRAHCSALNVTCSDFFSSSARLSCSLICLASNWDTWQMGRAKLCFESMVDQRGQVQRKLVKTRYLSLQLVILLLERCDELLVSGAPTHLVIDRHEVFGLELKDVIKKWTTSMFRKR